MFLRFGGLEGFGARLFHFLRSAERPRSESGCRGTQFIGEAAEECFQTGLCKRASWSIGRGNAPGPCLRPGFRTSGERRQTGCMNFVVLDRN